MYVTHPITVSLPAVAIFSRRTPGIPRFFRFSQNSQGLLHRLLRRSSRLTTPGAPFGSMAPEMDDRLLKPMRE